MERIILNAFLLMWLVLIPKLEAAEHTGPGLQVAQAPVYKDGWSWTYRAVEKYYDGTWTSNMLNGDFEITLQGGRPKIFWLEDGQKSQASNPGALNHMLPPKGVVQDRPQYFQFPLKVGANWKDGFKGGRWLNAENSVVGIETVTTPAGTFSAFRIERHILYTSVVTDLGNHQHMYVTEISFYSPQTRSVVKYHFQLERKLDLIGDLFLVQTKDIELIKRGSTPSLVTAAAPGGATGQKVGTPKNVGIKNPPAQSEVKNAAQAPKPAESALGIETKNVSAAPTATIYVDSPTDAKLPPKTQDTSAMKDTKSQDLVPSWPAGEEIALANAEAMPVASAPLTLRMNIIGQRKEADDTYTDIRVNDGSVLRSRDNFQVHFETTSPAFIYILLYDSQGKASQLFPDPKIDQPNFVEGGKKIAIPGENFWFWLDENPGTETVYVVASKQSMLDIKGLLAKMESADDSAQQRASQEIKQRIAVMQRGVGGVTKGQTVTYTLTDGKKIQKVTDVVEGTGSVVRAVSFQHR
jgi:Domain of unknown function (DUF4384)